MYNTIKKADDFYIIEDKTVRCFLFLGQDKALLIDTGISKDDLCGYVREITPLPVTLAITHADIDHVGANDQFAECLLYPSEISRLRKHVPNQPVKPLWEGDVIEVGSYCFEILHIPGHTPGSIAFLDRKKRMMIGGDSIQMGPVFMFGDGRDIECFLESMNKLAKLDGAVDVIYASHNELEVPFSQVRVLADGAKAVLDGIVEGVTPPRELPCKLYDYKGARFLY